MSTCPKSVFLLIIAFSAIFLFWTEETSAANLLINPGFENGIGNWALGVSTATFSATSTLKHDGEYSALLTKKNSKSWAYFYQKVNVESEKYYRLSGWMLLNDGYINNIKLRFYWLDSSENKISGVEREIKGSDSSFRFLETEAALSPAIALFAEVQGYVYLDSENPVNPALFDDLIFEESVAPTPTPEPEEEIKEEFPLSDSNSDPTPALVSGTPTPTKKPTPRPTPTLTPTSTPSGEILGEEATPTAEVVSFNTTQESTPSSFHLQNFLPFIFIGLGSLFIAIAGGSVLLPQIKKKYNIKRRGENKPLI